MRFNGSNLLHFIEIESIIAKNVCFKHLNPLWRQNKKV